MARQYDNYGRDQINIENLQGNATFNQTQIIQIAIAEIKTRSFNPTSPYRGLKPFDRDDKDYFFGRDQFLTGLVNELEQTNLVLLLGASGSGKSSVVRAGLLPWLTQKWGSQLIDLTLIPDQDPFEALYGCLLKYFKQSEAQMVRSGTVNALSQMVQSLKQPDSFWLLFVDQFEELFTTSQPEQRNRFLQSLVQLSRDYAGDPSLKIVVTMRADFLDRLDLAPANRLARITEKHRPLMTQMHPDELRLVIEQPAAQHGAVFEEGLVEMIIKDVQGQPGYLPLLQYTLNRLWEEERQTGQMPQERTLHTQTYLRLGGVRGALQKHVDDIYQRLQQQGDGLTTQRIFLRLVEIGGDAESGTEWKPVRRRASRAEFQDEREKAVLAELIDETLVVSDRDLPSPTQVSTVEIAHEILLTCWTFLNTWIKENRQAIALRNRLNDDVARWQAKKAVDELWTGSKLEQALELSKDPTFNQTLGGFSPTAIAFMKASEGKRDSQRRRVLLGLSGFSIAALTLAGFALYQLQQAQRQRMEQLVATAEALLSTQPVDSEINAIAAMGLSQSLFVRFPNHSIPSSVHTTLMKVFQVNQEQNQLKLEWFVRCVALSPDDKTIVGGGEDKMLHLWDAVTGQPIGTPLKGHTDFVTAVAVSPDGKMIASGGADQTVRLWDAATGQPIGTPLKGHTDWVTAVAFGPDSKRVVSSSYDKTIRMWNVVTGKLIGNPLKGHQDAIESVAFSPDGKTIASGSYDRTVRLWNAATGKQIGTPLRGHTQQVWSVAFSPDGKRIVSGSDDQTIRLWNTSTGKPIGNPLTGHESLVTSVAFSRDGKKIVSGSRDKTVRLWDALTGQPLGKPFYGPASMVRSVAFSSDGKRIVSGSDDQTIRLWDASIGPPYPLTGHVGEVNSIAFSLEGKRIVSGSSDKTIRLWDVSTGQPIGNPLEGHTEEITSVAFSPDGKRIVSSSYDKTVRLWDVSASKQISIPLTEHTDTVTSAVFSPDGKTIASGSHDKTVRLWNAATGRSIGKPFTGHTGWVRSVAFSPNGKTVASGSVDMTIRLWNVNTGQPIGHPFTGHTGEITSVAFSPDGKTIASGSRDKTLRLWDALTGELIGRPFTGHTEEVTSVAFSPDGKTIASGSSDITVRLWNVSTGQPMGNPLTGPTNWVTSIAFSRDGKHIASGNKDSTIRLWSVSWAIDWQDALATACKQLEHHTFLQSPSTNVAKEAKITCQKYVWSNHQF